MKWKKLGKIFDPTDYNLPNSCGEFAQSPQALVFDDFVRVYFSSREKDPTGKFKSHICFCDFDKDFSKVLKVSERPVISLGELGTFDEHGIFPINVVRDENRIIAYTCGWSRRISVSVETSVGFALSKDNGLTFDKIGAGPILSSSLKEPFLVGDAFVAKFNSSFHMWYIFGTKWIESETEEAQRVYKIAHAISTDGINWTRDSKCIIPDVIDENECQALPTVVYLNNRYHMYFCFREAFGFRKVKGKGYRLGYAYSDNLIDWTRDDKQAGISMSDNGWDSDMMCYPHIFHCGDQTYLLYNGNEFGRKGFGIAILDQL